MTYERIVEIEIDELLDNFNVQEILDGLDDRDILDYVHDKGLLEETVDAKETIEQLVRERTRSFPDKATVTEVMLSIIDELY